MRKAADKSQSDKQATAKILLCVDPSPAQQAWVRRIAQAHQLQFLACQTECGAMSNLASGQKFAVMVIAHQLAGGDSLSVIETARLSPHHVTLPIALLMGDRKPALAQNALNAGATEIFLRSEHQALMNFVDECSAASDETRFGGKVLLVEDSESHAQYVLRLCEALGMTADVAQDVSSAEKRYRQHTYQLIIVDVVLKDTKSGISFVREIRQTHGSRQPILVMSSFDDIPRRIMAMKCGADDFISKPFTPEEFVWRARKVMERHADHDTTSFGDAHHPELPPDALLSQLSRRESEIFQMIIAGKSDREIASALGISFWTVRGHIQHIFGKTGAINRRELMSRFIPAARKKPTPALPE